MNNNNNNNRGNNNSNSSNNNRRRGRGNRPGGGSGGGGGQQLNRIDSRARGNAPQLLEKYRKLAQDAHLNGDRVQAEYYLQFADHYFRVTADSRVRTDEQRARPGERFEGSDGDDDGSDFSLDNDFPSFDQPSYNRGPREDRPRQMPQEQTAQAPRDGNRSDADAPQSADADADVDAGNARVDAANAGDAGEQDAQPNPYEPPANPFVRDRNRGGLKPRRVNRPVQDDGDEAGFEPAGLDPAMLPPAIAASRAAEPAEDVAKPRRGRPRKKPLEGDAGETLESVS